MSRNNRTQAEIDAMKKWASWFTDPAGDVCASPDYYDYEPLCFLLERSTIGMNLGRYYAELSQ